MAGKKPKSEPKSGEVFLPLSPNSKLDDSAGKALEALQQSLGRPLWLLAQNGEYPEGTLDEPAWEAFLGARSKALKPDQKVALLLDSPGGQVRAAFKIAQLLRTHCGGFDAVVPRFAKSAATLLTLGADRIIMGQYSELGPLDVQILDPDKERLGSALDEVQSLERLFASSLEAIDQTMLFLTMRAGKKVNSLLPLTLQFVTAMVQPMIDKIDTVHFTQVSRMLKVAEEYAVRLLSQQFPQERAEMIARHLVENYPEHGFVIDIEEARAIGLHVERATAEQEEIFASLQPLLGRVNCLGPIQRREVSS